MKAREFWIDERTGSIVKYDGEIAFGDNFQFVRVREVPDSPDTQSAEAAESYRIGLSRRREFSDDEMADAFLAGVQWNQARLDEAQKEIERMKKIALTAADRALESARIRDEAETDAARAINEGLEFKVKLDEAERVIAEMEKALKHYSDPAQFEDRGLGVTDESEAVAGLAALKSYRGLKYGK